MKIAGIEADVPTKYKRLYPKIVLEKAVEAAQFYVSRRMLFINRYKEGQSYSIMDAVAVVTELSFDGKHILFEAETLRNNELTDKVYIDTMGEAVMDSGVEKIKSLKILCLHTDPEKSEVGTGSVTNSSGPPTCTSSAK